MGELLIYAFLALPEHFEPLVVSQLFLPKISTKFYPPASQPHPAPFSQKLDTSPQLPPAN
jgi:hypothetical protein